MVFAGLRLRGEDERRLRAIAERAGAPVTTIIREELNEFTRTGLPWRVRARLLHLSALSRDLTERRERVTREATRIRELLLKTNTSAIVRAASTLLNESLHFHEEELARIDAELTQIQTERDTMKHHHRLRDTHLAPALFPLALALPTQTPQIVFGAILIALALIVARRRYGSWANVLAKAVGLVKERPDTQAITTVQKGIDAGSPRAPAHFEPGFNEDELLAEFRHNPKFLRDKLQAFLDQDDGLERMRQFSEEEQLQVYDGAEWAEVHVLICTEEQLREIPEELQHELMSERRKMRTSAPRERTTLIAATTGPKTNGRSATPKEASS